MTFGKCLLITKGSKAIGAIIWTIAQQFSLATLYDAAILAVAELEAAEFWTADESLLNTLTPCPGYVQKLEA
jgi:predicted nucleic acid-binding protein